MFGLAAVVVLVMLIVAGVWRPWQGSDSALAPSGRGRGFNVLLITLDTTRADTLGCYGHAVVKTPNIDTLAREGVMFTQCTTTVPITLPSHASIMTATYPFVHRARDNGRYLSDEGNVTIAELLREAGYATGAEVGAYVLDIVWGLAQGFDSYRSETTPEQRGKGLDRLATSESEPGDAVCARAVEWLGRHASERFFLWVHFFDPHHPWRPPERFKTPYAHHRFGAYWGEISFVDEQIGRLMAELRRTGVQDRTLVVLTADHGEGLLQHKELTHVYYVYDSTMLVPLIFWCPSLLAGGRRIDSQVRTVDITPTILALVGLDAKPDADGVSLLPLLGGAIDDLGLAAYGESVSAHNSYGYARLRALRADGWKYIHAPRAELYNVGSDPRESVNLSAQYPEQVESMRGALEQLIAESMTGAAGEQQARVLDTVAVEKLAALGYVGGYAPHASTESELELFQRFEGPDPKDHIDAYDRFQEARAWHTAKQPQKAEPLLAQLIAAEPSNPAFREYYAVLLHETGRLEEAAEQFQVLLSLQPENAPAHFRLGNVYGKLNRLSECVTHLSRAVELMPQFPEAHTKLALGLGLQYKLEESERHFKKALELDPTSSEARLSLGNLMHHDGRYAEAVQVVREGLHHRPDEIDLMNNLAWYLATLPVVELRDGPEAVRLAEVICQRVGEDSPAVLDTLAAAYAEVGRFEEAVSAARRASEMAESSGQSVLAADIRARLALYEAGRPFRQGS